MNEFQAGYIEAMLWSSSGDTQSVVGETAHMSEISPELMTQINQDCQQFWDTNHELFTDANYLRTINPQHASSIEALAGHDFWLTRNHHGCGFWDGDWTNPVGSILTEAAHAFGECEIYRGKDGLIYGSR